MHKILKIVLREWGGGRGGRKRENFGFILEKQFYKILYNSSSLLWFWVNFDFVFLSLFQFSRGEAISIDIKKIWKRKRFTK